MGICCSSLTAELEASDDNQLKLTSPPPELYYAFGPTAVPPSSSSSFSSAEIARKKSKKKKMKMVLRRARVNESGGGGKKVQLEGSAAAAKAKPKTKTNKREAAEEEEEVLLSCAPGRLFGNGSSEGANCLYTQQGRKGINQDAMLLWENFGSKNDAVFCGVFDGHGPFGHMVARRVRDSLPLKLSAQWTAHESSNNSLIESISAGGSMNSEDAASICVDEECTDSLVLENNDQKPPEIYMMLKQSFLKAYRLMDKELKLHPSIDCFCSGTTAVTFLKKGEDLVIANVGDSRAVLGTRDQEGSLTALQLTVDLKPNLPREAERIQKCKGRVFALQDEPEVARVWLPNNDSPGLAMARAFGDFCLKDFGLISVPDVSYRHLSDKDEFVVLATDGVWDVLTNQEVVDVVDSAPTRAMAARAVVECAVRSWRLKFPTSKSDDCAVVCFFLKDLLVSDTKFVVQEPDVQEPDEAAASCTTTAEVPIIQTSQHSDGRVQDTGDHLQHPSTMTVVAPERVIGVEDEIVPAQEIMEPKEVATPPQQDERSYSRRSLAECIMSSEDEEWSALEGVTRVNSLLNLPRLLSRDKSRSSSWRKWL